MNKLFNKVKAGSILKIYIRILIMVLIVVISLILDLIFKKLFYLIIGISLAMIINVVTIAVGFKREKNVETLTSTLRKKYLVYLKKIDSNELIKKAYKIFDYKQYFDIDRVFYGMQGNLDGIDIISQSLEGKIGFCKHFVRIYVFKNFKNKNFNLYNIDKSILSSFRYELKDDVLYLSIIYKSYKESFNPIYFKDFDEYENRYKKEDLIIKSICREIGGNIND